MEHRRREQRALKAPAIVAEGLAALLVLANGRFYTMRFVRKLPFQAQSAATTLFLLNSVKHVIRLVSTCCLISI